MDKMIGSILGGRYTIQEVVGVGGMSVVYKAADALEDRPVAIKVLKDEFLLDAHFRRRFLNESRAIAMLSHKNIVDVYDVNFEGDIQYIVMEFIKGITLKEYFSQKGPLSVDEAINYTRQILSALQHAHERGVVHRDVKPHNIMLLDDGSIKVTDFGIAHVSNFDTVTMTDKAIGSVHYISPEQAKGQATDEKSDIYSVGIILYEMMTGVLPFEAETPVSVALMQVQMQPKKPSETRLDIPQGMEQIILKAMTKSTAARYQNAACMLDDLMSLDIDNTVTFNYSFEQQPEDFATITMSAVKESVAQKPEVLLPKKPAKKVNSLKWSYIRNKTLAVIAGMFLAFVLALLGIGTMFTITARLSETLLNVPSLVGRSLTEVEADPAVNRYFALNRDSRYDDTVEAGIIIEQSPTSGKFISGKEISIIVSKGKRMVNVPSIVGSNEAEAIVLLKEEDLTYERIPETSQTIAEGKIIRTDPAFNTSVSIGTVVKIYVSINTAASQVYVPNVIGLTKDRAITVLYQKGLSYSIREEYSETTSSGEVIYQSVAEDEIVDSGTEIVIYVSKGSISEAMASGLYSEDNIENNDVEGFE